jgi:aminoglycoside phosphotransferase (APT) family kinase protein
VGRPHITPGQVRDLLAEHLPAVAVRAVVPLSAGPDDVAFLVVEDVEGRELVVRFATAADAASRVTREAAVLAVVARVAPVNVPAPVLTVPERGCLAYAKLAGVSLLDLPLAERAVHLVPVATVLGELIAALHEIPEGEVAPLAGGRDDPPERWLRDAAAIWETVAVRVPARHHRPIESRLLAAPPPERGPERVLCHNGLGAEHVLVVPATGTVTGVIEWRDAALGDPALDFGLVLRDLGPAALEAALARYPSAAHGPGLRERALFFARCSVLQYLAHGIETGHDARIAVCLDAIRRLFPV